MRAMTRSSLRDSLLQQAVHSVVQYGASGRSLSDRERPRGPYLTSLLYPSSASSFLTPLEQTLPQITARTARSPAEVPPRQKAGKTTEQNTKGEHDRRLWVDIGEIHGDRWGVGELFGTSFVSLFIISYFPFPASPLPSLSPSRRVARPAVLYSSPPLHRIVGTTCCKKTPRLLDRVVRGPRRALGRATEGSLLREARGGPAVGGTARSRRAAVAKPECADALAAGGRATKCCAAGARAIGTKIR